MADPGSAYQLVTMMQGVVERGTGVAVKAVGKPIAGKTGTTNEYRDAWFEGFNPDLAAGVYVGYDEPDSLGKDETGGHVAAPIFRDFMIDALKNTPAVDFRIPPGLRLYRVSAATGLPVSGNEPAIYEAYKPGTEPGKSSRPPTQASIQRRRTLRPILRRVIPPLATLLPATRLPATPVPATRLSATLRRTMHK